MFQYINLLKGIERHHSMNDADVKKMSVYTMFLSVFVWSQVHSINAATKSEEVLNSEVLTQRI